MKKNKTEPIGKYILDSSINYLKCCFSEYRKVHIQNMNNWLINDKGECVFLGELELMYDKEKELKKKYERAYKEVIKLKAEYARKGDEE